MASITSQGFVSFFLQKWLADLCWTINGAKSSSFLRITLFNPVENIFAIFLQYIVAILFWKTAHFSALCPKRKVKVTEGR